MDAIILAGGKSRRLGRDKAWEPIEGEPLLTRVARRLAVVFSHLTVVSPTGNLPPLPPGTLLVEDEMPGHGPLGAICAGLGHIRGDRAFAAACDLPFVSPHLARWLWATGEQAPVVLPLINGKGEPLHAVYSKACRPLLLDALARGDLSLQAVLFKANPLLVSEAELRRLDPELLSFLNVNTQADLNHAWSLLPTNEAKSALSAPRKAKGFVAGTASRLSHSACAEGWKA
jgi:molybdopterin-guanine dinucleotide biosynthesis protein A